MTRDRELASRYATTVADYLQGAGEAALHDAYQIGREALEQGIGPLVLFSIHRDVVNGLPLAAHDRAELTGGATTVFIETLAPFQLAYTGLDEARGAVADLGSLIHRQAAELDLLGTQPDDLQPTAGPLRELRSMFGRHLGDLEHVRGRLEQTQQTAESRRQEISSIVSAQEQERRRLAGEIHDDALQAMAAVSLRLGMAARRITDSEQQMIIRQLEATTRGAIDRLRRLLAGLQPHELDRAGLAAAVRIVLEQLQSDFGIECVLRDDLVGEPGHEARTVAFRIIREALANICKHANASRIGVALESRNEGLLARVTDDGGGFDAQRATDEAEPGQLGIAAMRERAKLAGGWLTINSRPGTTAVDVWIPDTRGSAAL